MKVCKMGWVQVRWPAARELWPLFQSHTWVLDGKYAQDYGGSIYPDTDTIVHGDGGGAICDGDLLTHDPMRCGHE